MTTRIVGVDPGPHRCGWAAIDAGARLPYELVDCGMVDSDPVEGVWAIVERHAAAGPVVVAVEVPSGYIHQHARGAALLATARVAGQIGAFARMHDARLFEASAAQWRRALCGKSTAGDPLVKLAFARYVRFAKPNQRTSNHVRDAAGVAVTAAMNPKAWT